MEQIRLVDLPRKEVLDGGEVFALSDGRDTSGVTLDAMKAYITKGLALSKDVAAKDSVYTKEEVDDKVSKAIAQSITSTINASY